MKTFRSERSGMAAVEFALILPLMLIIYLGGYDVMRMVRASDKLENASKITVDLTIQEPTGNSNPQSDFATILQAATAAAAPFNDANLTITVSAIDLSIVNGQCCTATVRWSATQGGTLRPCKTNLREIAATDAWAVDTIPNAIANPKVVTINKANSYTGSIIVTDASYVYSGVSPIISGIVSSTMWRHSYGVPRLLGQVPMSTTSGMGSNQTAKVC